ncbi:MULTISPECIES: DUF1187 family protein [unclassified Gilliamella]|nr:DUF1187 family protein [Gilliamella sp. B3722]MCX8611917.1 DUF1187 family protein [Gilliamella sp. B3891]MCX8614369.1 DUF1187 family protein [Gilliamella sp. B3773]MCX8621622.1 DUF1187 family protein [Gilliamella sp. B3892]MCX8624055.1 DUF1187 family protein [Gilliamella sp. B3759]MCX8631362.1 DUF1187 family protein [Gilliamella sp. B3724]MCX8631881.1 DUF1187 family protein [Gilliamella sp. B3927]MCX8636248.1 DUF1187 family protein [Gilliamella sp. B3758]
MIYKITGIIIRNGQQPINWMRFSNKKLNHLDCEKMVDGQIIEFKCERV